MTTDFALNPRVRLCRSAGSIAVGTGGAIFGLLYIAYLVIVGLQRAHEFDSVKALLTLGITTVVGGFLALALGGSRWVWLSWRLVL